MDPLGHDGWERESWGGEELHHYVKLEKLVGGTYCLSWLRGDRQQINEDESPSIKKNCKWLMNSREGEGSWAIRFKGLAMRHL